MICLFIFIFWLIFLLLHYRALFLLLFGSTAFSSIHILLCTVIINIMYQKYTSNLSFLDLPSLHSLVFYQFRNSICIKVRYAGFVYFIEHEFIYRLNVPCIEYFGEKIITVLAAYKLFLSILLCSLVTINSVLQMIMR